ncbi:uracil-DNA glycosylase, partial [Hydrogenophaga taeniospiralis]
APATPAARPVPAPAAAPSAAATAAAPLGLRPVGIDTMDWPALQAAVAGCEACSLCRSRKNTVFGVGDTQADWMVIGEAPGENEDLQGEPFVGAAGQLLDNMLRAVGRSRSGSGEQGAYIANVLKCRPPANRNPQPQEVAQCEPYLARQVALVQPKVIIAMGRFAVQSLLQTSEPIGRLRGQVHRYQGVPVIVTYHPAYLLRTPGDKGKAWADLCLAMETVAAE